jgi:GDP-L-fucose synthase
MLDLTNKRIMVTGGKGFLGGHIIDQLKLWGAHDVMSIDHDMYDLRDSRDVYFAYEFYRPEVVIHCAAKVGGIGLNKAKPGELFFDNAIMGMLLMDEARQRRVEKFVQLGTICSYPKNPPIPFVEEDLWDGYPEETNAPYGISKRALITMGQAYRKQYGLNAINLLPVNLYGPRDHFNLETCHVIPAMIRKFDDAIKSGAETITFWGTGLATREFIYVEDAARAIVAATEHYDKPEPVNIGTGIDIPIRSLALMIAEKMGYKGEIHFNADMPDGQPHRRLDISKAKREFDFEPRWSLDEGLDKTIEWYKENPCAK